MTCRTTFSCHVEVLLVIMNLEVSKSCDAEAYERVVDKRETKEIALAVLLIGGWLIEQVVEMAREAGLMSEDPKGALDDSKPAR